MASRRYPPSGVRRHRERGAGKRLEVGDTPQGVLLRPAPAFTPTRPEDVLGLLPHGGEPKTLEEMDAGVLAEARRRIARD
ncbi:AbrB family transcriptional regulator [Mesorhizobium sp.]|uniref:AbrB family transcriptional regulator n=1 Tax=Mesorhizobium sp. TaxID=1871066 RepID=UPI0025F7175D|nr:AbrB family transcriptional regulator [Mesorhizobium sp.]